MPPEVVVVSGFPPADFGKLTFTNSLGPSRCFPFWQEVLGCYVVNAGDGETGKKKCLPALEDYHECLHHRKEVRCDAHARLGYEVRERYMIWLAHDG